MSGSAVMSSIERAVPSWKSIAPLALVFEKVMVSAPLCAFAAVIASRSVQSTVPQTPSV